VLTYLFADAHFTVSAAGILARSWKNGPSRLGQFAALGRSELSIGFAAEEVPK
jgi:hypothetical protein